MTHCLPTRLYPQVAWPCDDASTTNPFQPARDKRKQRSHESHVRRLPTGERGIGHDEPTTDPASVVAMTGSYGEPAVPVLRENDPLAPLPAAMDA
jgi:hypothetical protein